MKKPPVAPPARRHLPLAPDVRDLDRQARPILAVWELTLACDLACGHCGSRAGKARPDELTTAEALALVDQLAALGIVEVVLIGGEAYLREDWLQIIERIAARGMQPLLTTGGRRFTREPGYPPREGAPSCRARPATSPARRDVPSAGWCRPRPLRACRSITRGSS